MANAIFTITKLKTRTLGGGGVAGIYSLVSDSGDYVTGGIAVTPTLETIIGLTSRSPDFVTIQASNGFKYEYDLTNKKVKIFVATTAGTNAAENEHTVAAVVAGARTGAVIFAVWLPY